MEYVIRNYGPSRSLPYKGKYVFLAHDQAVIVEDAALAEAMSGFPQISVSTRKGIHTSAPLTKIEPEKEPLERQTLEQMKKRELVQLAFDMDLELPEQIRKNDLIVMLLEASQGQAQEPEDE